MLCFQAYGIHSVRLSFAYVVSVIIVCDDSMNYRNEYASYVEMPGDCFMEMPCILHEHAGFAGKAFQKILPVL